MVTHPTVIVGVGQAGINVMSTLDEIVQTNDEKKMFEYIAIDSDKTTLNRAPTDATKIPLSVNTAFKQEDIAKYPYLTEDMRIEGTGALRQRSVGRYLVDGRGDDGYDDIFSEIKQTIANHYTQHKNMLKPDSASFNIFFIHSMGGGTGSGSYPLLTTILNEIAEEKLQSADELVYLAGVGVVPMITFDPDIHEPDGDSRYYPNAYAALRDLKTFIDLHSNEDGDTLELPSYAQTYRGRSTVADEDDIKGFSLRQVPFDDYWLVGVNEAKITGDISSIADESYRTQTNQAMARSIHAISKLGESAENWSDSTPYTGTFAQSEVSVPHDKVKQFVELRETREEKQNRIETAIPDEIEKIEQRKAELETLKREVGSLTQIADDDLQTEILGRVEGPFPSGAYMVENGTADEIRDFFDKLEEDYDIEGMIIAIDQILDKAEDERAAPAIQNDWQETVKELWSDWTMQTRTKYGGGGVKTLEGKATTLEDFLEDKMSEFEKIKDDWNPSLFGQLQDTLPPIIGPFESEKEYAERWLEIVKDDYQELERVMGEWGRVEKLIAAIEEQKQSVRGQIDDQLNQLNSEITDLQTEREELQERIRRLESNIGALREELLNERLSSRIAVLPIKEDRVEDLDTVVVEEDLTSLKRYVEKGFVSEDKARFALSKRLENAQSWKKDIVNREMSKTEERRNFKPINDMWYLYHEDNRELFADYITDRPRAVDDDGEREAGTSGLNYLSDPYRIEYISYTRRGPLAAFRVFQHFEQLENDKHLDEMARQYEDYRQAFAYLEWYGKNIQRVFDVSFNIRVNRPPELKEQRVDKPELDDGELKNWIVNPGLVMYLWEGNMAEHIESGEEVFRGWKGKLNQNGITFTDLQIATPDSRHISEWLADQRKWDDILEMYQDNLIELTETKLIFKDKKE